MSDRNLLAGLALIALTAGCGQGREDNMASSQPAIDAVANDVMANSYETPVAPGAAGKTTPTAADVEAKVVEMIVEHLGVERDRVTMSARFREDLKADSLELVELVMAFEEDFGVEIPDDDAEKILTVGDAVTYIRAHIAA